MIEHSRDDSPNGFTLRYYPESEYVEVHPARAKPASEGVLPPTLPLHRLHHRWGFRGQTKDYSHQAHMRFLRHLRAFSPKELTKGICITLTYGPSIPDPTTTKKHLDTFLKRLLRRYRYKGLSQGSGEVRPICIIWRLEYQERGAPHYHLLVLGIHRIDMSWLRRAWGDAIQQSYQPDDTVGSPDEHNPYSHPYAHTYASSYSYSYPYVDIKRVRSVRGLISYITKRAGERHMPDNHHGRFWGIRGNKEAFLARYEEIPISQSQLVSLKRNVRKLELSRARQYAKPKKRATAIVRARRRGSRMAYSRGLYFSGLASDSLKRILEEGSP